MSMNRRRVWLLMTLNILCCLTLGELSANICQPRKICGLRKENILVLCQHHGMALQLALHLDEWEGK